MNSYNARALPRADALLKRAARLSHYARRLVEATPPAGFDARIERSFSASEMRTALAAQPAADEDSLKRALRALRSQVMLHLIARDLGGLAPLAEVMETTTMLAEVTVGHAAARLDEWLTAQHGRPVGAASGSAQLLHVVGMGKLGGAELNVSSIPRKAKRRGRARSAITSTSRGSGAG
jgi:[glutamine synthetase] adenylyltransferase / [glutamine synthetase]-adenylyl-L-tyrosine phosphorylase